MRALLICPWFGPMPEWWWRYWPQEDALKEVGYEIALVTDRAWTERLLMHELRVGVSLEEGGTKMHDLRPVLGYLYRELIAEGGYDWWGHTDFDCVYGRLNQFVTPEKLADCDIYTDCAYTYLAGPFTLYRVGATEDLFRDVTDWRDQLANPDTTGWVEKSFTAACMAQVRVTVENNHAFTEPHLLERRDGKLVHFNREVSFYHFNRSKKWPL